MSGTLRMLLPGSAVVGDLRTSPADAVQALADLYAYPAPVPARGWVRANMVTTIDGSATGADGRSGSISREADRAVFSVLRGLADVVLVGAGTARAEGYRPAQARPEFAERRERAGQRAAPVIAVVTRSGNVPTGTGLFDAGPTAGGAPAAVAITCGAADVAALRHRLGAERVIVAGEDDVDPDIAVAQLVARGLRRVLLEGGPSLLGRTIAAGRLDELCLTASPVLAGGDGPRIAHGAPGGLPLRMAHLVECDGLLLGRWLVQRA
jgi:riboflavin biosynthesis pyrimidine reductase